MAGRSSAPGLGVAVVSTVLYITHGIIVSCLCAVQVNSPSINPCAFIFTFFPSPLVGEGIERVSA